MDGHRAGLREPAFTGSECFSVAIADDDKVCARTTDAIDFVGGCDRGNKDLRGDAEFAGGVRDGDAVISAGGSDYAGLGNVAREQIGEGANTFPAYILPGWGAAVLRPCLLWYCN